jgi:hypothetical protein
MQITSIQAKGTATELLLTSSSVGDLRIYLVLVELNVRNRSPFLQTTSCGKVRDVHSLLHTAGLA